MTGRDLLRQLQALPDDDLDLNVEVYTNSEDGNSASTMEVLAADEEPYYKGDGPWGSGSVPRDERLIFIR